MTTVGHRIWFDGDRLRTEEISADEFYAPALEMVRQAPEDRWDIEQYLTEEAVRYRATWTPQYWPRIIFPPAPAKT